MVLRVRSGAGLAVQREAGRVGVAAAEGALEADVRALPRGDAAVVVQRGGRDGLAALAVGGAPAAGDLLVTGEGEAERPAVDGGAAGVGDRHAAHEATGPLAL